MNFWEAVGKFFVSCIAGSTGASLILHRLPGASVETSADRLSKAIALNIFTFPLCAAGLLAVIAFMAVFERVLRPHPVILVVACVIFGAILGYIILSTTNWHQKTATGLVYGSAVSLSWAILVYHSHITRAFNAGKS